mgnify:FL=1
MTRFFVNDHRVCRHCGITLSTRDRSMDDVKCSCGRFQSEPTQQEQMELIQGELEIFRMIRKGLLP